MKDSFLQIFKPVVEKIPRLSLIYRYLRDNWPHKMEPHNTVFGFKLIGHIRSTEEGLFEPEETKLFCGLLPIVDYVINIGANTGYYCCLALSYNKKVIAFEPISSNVQLLLKNIRINQWESEIEVYPIALSNRTGVCEIFGGRTSASLVKGWAGNPSGYVNLIPCSTLNITLGSRLTNQKLLILVDIEGSEHLMIEGASEIINMNPKPIWLIEICITENQPVGIKVNPNLLKTFNLFWESGYEVLTADEEFRKISPEEIKSIFQTGINTIQTTNFLFFDADNREILKINSLKNTLKINK
jgi:FkbM family methyltransferase